MNTQSQEETNFNLTQHLTTDALTQVTPPEKDTNQSLVYPTSLNNSSPTIPSKQTPLNKSQDKSLIPLTTTPEDELDLSKSDKEISQPLPIPNLLFPSFKPAPGLSPILEETCYD
jgi:hypothetical protein